MNAPSPRYEHSTVWTRSEMIVWGGYAGSTDVGKLGDGARYDPVTDTWTTLPATGAPAPRYNHAAAFTGTEMVVWSSRGVSGEFADCATYDVEKDTWAPIPASATLTAREYLTAIAAPGGVLLWGGYSYNASSTYGDGATFDAANGALSAMSGVGAPLPRYHHAAAWTGESMIVFGGSDLREGMWLGRGGVYFP